jgi:hypothetical protein
MTIIFNGSQGPTVGAELELQSIDLGAKNLVSGAPQMIESSQDQMHVKSALVQSIIGINTDVCQNMVEARRELYDRMISFWLFMTLASTSPLERRLVLSVVQG